MKQLIVIKAIALVVLVALAVSSCSPSGYGCKGRSKYITGHRPNGY